MEPPNIPPIHSPALLPSHWPAIPPTAVPTGPNKDPAAIPRVEPTPPPIAPPIPLWRASEPDLVVPRTVSASIPANRAFIPGAPLPMNLPAALMPRPVASVPLYRAFPTRLSPNTFWPARPTPVKKPPLIRVINPALARCLVPIGPKISWPRAYALLNQALELSLALAYLVVFTLWYSSCRVRPLVSHGFPSGNVLKTDDVLSSRLPAVPLKDLLAGLPEFILLAADIIVFAAFCILPAAVLSLTSLICLMPVTLLNRPLRPLPTTGTLEVKPKSGWNALVVSFPMPGTLDKARIPSRYADPLPAFWPRDFPKSVKFFLVPFGIIPVTLLIVSLTPW